MANIKSVNGNTIVLDGSGIADEAVTKTKLDAALRAKADGVRENSYGTVADAGMTSLTASDWQQGAVQTNSNVSTFGQIISATSGLVTPVRQYASRDVQVWCDAGWEMAFHPYASDSDSSYKYGQSGYSYAVLMWHQILLVPKGNYYRIVLRKVGAQASDVLDPAVDSKHVHFVTEEAGLLGDGNIAPSLKWKVGTMSAGVPTWTQNTHLLMADIVEAKRPIKVVADDSVVRPYVAYYDESGATLRSGFRVSMIPAGARFRLDLNIRDGSDQGHYGMVEALQLIEMDGNFPWLGATATDVITYADNRIIMCMPERHDYPVVISLPDYSKYLVGAYLKTNGNVVSTFDWEGAYDRPVGVPAGQWYHVYMAKADNTAFSAAEFDEAVGMLRVEQLEGYPSPIDGVRNDVSLLKRRVTALEGETIPAYYESQTYSLDGRIADILAANPQPKETVAQFAFATDFHFTEYSNQLKARMLLNKVFAKTNCSMFVDGGDVVDGKLIGSGLVTPIDFAKQMQHWSNWVIPDSCGLALQVVGNHDGGASWNPSGDALIDEHTLYEVSAIARTAGNVVLDPNGECQLYVDDPYHKIRWIVGNYGNTTNVGHWDVSQGHGVLGESKSDCLSFVGWALDSMDDGWIAVVFNHILINSWDNGPVKGAANLESLCDAYNARSSATLDSRMFDFSDARGEVACIIGGHLHLDYDYETTGGIPCIVVTTDNAGAQCSINESTGKPYVDARQAGTPEEQAIDVFTIDTENRTISTVRIGFGEDRSWTY